MSFFQKINNVKFTGDWLIDGKTYSAEDDVKPILDAGAAVSLFQLYKDNGGKLTTEEEFLSRLVALIDVGVEEEDYVYYGYIQQKGLTMISAITEDILTYSETITREPLAVGTHKIDLPEACLMVIAIPSNKGLEVLQDDGVGGKCTFNEDVGNLGITSGANGIPLTVRGKEYLLYGELVIADVTATIYVVEKTS